MIEQPKHEDCEECIYKTSVNKSKLNDLVMLTNGERLFLLKLVNEEYQAMHNGRRKATTLKFDRCYSLKEKLKAKRST